MGSGSLINRKVKVQRLDSLEQNIAERPWIFMGRLGNLSALESFAREVVAARGDFPKPSTREGQRVERICYQLKVELQGAVNTNLLKNGDALMIEKLKTIARDLDVALDLQVFPAVCSKITEVRLQVGIDELQGNRRLLQEWAKSTTAPEEGGNMEQQVAFLQKAQARLRAAHVHAREVDVLQADFVQQAKECAERMEGMVAAVLDVYPAGMANLESVASSLDAMCHRHVSWEPVVQRLTRIKCEKASSDLPQKLGEIEVELSANKDPDTDKVLLLLEQAVALWIPSEDKERFDACFVASCEHIEASFNGALGICDDQLHASIRAAEALEKLQVRWANVDPRASSEMATALVQNLHRQRAMAGIGSLMSQSRAHIDAAKLELRKLFESVEDRLKRATKEALASPVEPPRWSFRLASGGWKAWDAESSVRVESCFQEWLRDGKSASKLYEVQAQVEARWISSPDEKGASAREPCKYGAECFRRNLDHLQRFSHPGDLDWADAVSSPVSELKRAASVKVETYVISFPMMTQSAKSRENAQRTIRRQEGRGLGQQVTAEYFEAFDDFVNVVKTNLEKIEFDLGLLDMHEREMNEKKIDDLVRGLKDICIDFFTVASLVGDTQRRDDTIARMGTLLDGLDVDECLKDVKLSEALEELRCAFRPLVSRGGAEPAHGKWDLLRALYKDNLIEVRLGLADVKRDFQVHARRRAQMAFLSVLSDFGVDPVFKQKAYQAGFMVLMEAVKQNGDARDVGAVKEALKLARLASSPRQVASSMTSPVRDMAVGLVSSAIVSAQPLERLLEVLEACTDLAKLVDGRMSELCGLHQQTDAMVKKVADIIRVELFKISVDRTETKALADLIPVILKLLKKLKESDVFGEFYRLLCLQFKDIHAQDHGQPDPVRSPAWTEWVCAFCEATKQDLPDWMMTKAVAEASAKLQGALSSDDFVQLREAAIFAKQSDYKSDQSLVALYNECIKKLKELQRLPEGWEVENLLGDGAEVKMFKKVDFGAGAENQLFQQLFDETNLRIWTRDRKTRGTLDVRSKMPKAFKIQSVQMVMNAESWGSYQKRLDQVVSDCRRRPGSAPTLPEQWAQWSGKVLTSRLGSRILEAAQQPPRLREANEFLMFHGTKPEAADSIAQNHFDMAFACKTGLFGAGLYFGEAASKCDEYVQQREDGHFPMILCRVILGNIKYCGSKDPTAEPGRKALEDSCTPAGGYHSVLGDRKRINQTYREFVIYDHYQVYPLFIVWYTRSF